MDSDHLPAASPEPIAARSLGVANVVFGTLFILALAYEAGIVLAMPTFGRLMTWAQSQERLQQDARSAAQREAFEQRLSAAGSDEEREVIEAERTLADLGTSPDPQWFGVSLGFLDDPKLRMGVLVKFGVMTGLNGLLIASGIGLIRLRSWGRSTARIAAVLTLLATIGFTVVALPMASGMAGRWTAELREPMFPPTPDEAVAAAIDQELSQYEHGMTRLFAYTIVLSSVFPLVYPFVVLVVASRPGVGRAVDRAPGSRAEGHEVIPAP